MTQKSYEQRLADLGWSAKEADGRARQRITQSVEELERWMGVGPNREVAEAREVPSAETLRNDASMLRVYDAAMNHALGRRRISDPEVLAALEERASAFVIEAAAAPNITITAANPLILNGSGGTWLYDTVTLEEGGYIEIGATGHFQCSQLIKKSSSVPGPEFDISVLGKAGVGPAQPAKPGKPTKAGNGQDANCDCCGGLVDNDGTPGASGTPGTPGVNVTEVGNGGHGPTVVLSLGQITGSVSLVSRGGHGAPGAPGGNGGDGGDGGNGGKDIQCGAIKGNGGNGGRGGNGANGGNGGAGGNGGNGGNVTVEYDPASPGTLLPVNEEATGGTPGVGGQVGLGGLGGTSGGRGAVAGAPGDPGTQKGNDGSAGNRGTKGSMVVNGRAV